MTRQRLGSRRTLAGVLAILLGTAAAGAAPVPLGSTVTWTDASGRSGTGAFQGAADGGILTGVVSGGGQEVRVRGTIAEDGAVSGTLLSSQGRQIGSFSARLAEGGRLEGEWGVTGGVKGGWSAPADALPVPAAARRGGGVR
jgi:hypothetical protein